MNASCHPLSRLVTRSFCLATVVSSFPAVLGSFTTSFRCFSSSNCYSSSTDDDDDDGSFDMMKDAYQSRFVNGKHVISLAEEWEGVNEDLIQDNHPNNSSSNEIPESVLQYERQLRKRRAAYRTSKPLTTEQHLKILYEDEYVVVANKPSGILCVPGIHNNPSLLELVYNDSFHQSDNNNNNNNKMTQDQMIVHRLDMDTSGVVVFGRTLEAVSGIQKSFRDREVRKTYEALVCGHVTMADRGIVDLPLQRDHERPPFMRIATPASERAAAGAVRDLRHYGYQKLLRKKAKPCQTEWTVLSREYLNNDRNLPITRLSLTPITGRTHQLRVHCAALGHGIVGDPVYGIYGEASANGGFSEYIMNYVSPSRATINLQKKILLSRTVLGRRDNNNNNNDGSDSDDDDDDGGNDGIAVVRDEDHEQSPPMCLHAYRLSLKHPISGQLMTWEAPIPF